MYFDKKLTIIMPAFNEGEHIYKNVEETIKTIQRFAVDYEIIIVDDGSLDNTVKECTRAAKDFDHVKAILCKKNEGKSKALRVGTAEASKEGYIAFVDADLDLHPRQLEKFFRILKEENADIVIGSKLHKESEIDYPFSRRIISFCYYLFVKMLFGLNIHDTQTGMKLFKAEIIKSVMASVLVKRFAFDIEVLSLCSKRQYKICEAPISLDFSRISGFSRIGIKDILQIGVDTLAVFYRLRILNYYENKDFTHLKPSICFFLGTEAELIKVFPVILELNKRGIQAKIIASGQNDITKSRVLRETNGGQVDLLLSDEKDIKKTSLGLLKWFWNTIKNAKRQILDTFPNIDFIRSIMVVHGDTVSTVMGARLGRKLNMTIAHVEAGLRSHNLFFPFPEEIDRLITSRYAKIHFAPGKEPMDNLKRRKGRMINTSLNTIYDSLNFAQEQECVNDTITTVLKKKYFVMVAHRQENLANRKLMEKIVNGALEHAKTMMCVFVLHTPTRITLKKMGLLKKLEQSKNILCLSRAEFFDFSKLLANAQFIITDGGSNQEELYYMGKPCLILRNQTERKDGLGKNAVLYNCNISAIDEFIRQYKRYAISPVQTDLSPSKMIAEVLASEIGEDCYKIVEE